MFSLHSSNFFLRRVLFYAIAFAEFGLHTGSAQTFGSGFNSYTAVPLTSLATHNGNEVMGLAFAPGNFNQLVFDADNGASSITFYSATVLRNASTLEDFLTRLPG